MSIRILALAVLCLTATHYNYAATRQYYIAADEVEWDYTPTGSNQISGEPFSQFEEFWTKAGPYNFGTKVRKAIYQEYTDASFTQLKPRSPEWEHLGIMGPVEGGQSSAFWMYHSHTDESADVNAALMGPMIITAAGTSRPDGSPSDVDREFVVSFSEFSEIESRYRDHNINTYMELPDGAIMGRDPFGALALIPGNPDIPPVAHIRTSINGYLYGNLPMLTMNKGEKVRWYVMATTNFELHAPHWHGNTFRWRHMNADVIPLLTMGMEILDMEPDNPGIWMFHCHVAGHFQGGMGARYEVLDNRQAAD